MVSEENGMFFTTLCTNARAECNADKLEACGYVRSDDIGRRTKSLRIRANLDCGRLLPLWTPLNESTTFEAKEKVAASDRTPEILHTILLFLTPPRRRPALGLQ